MRIKSMHYFNLFCFVFSMASLNPANLMAQKKNSHKLKRVQSVKVDKTVYSALQRHEMFAELLVFKAGNTVAASNIARIYFFSVSNSYLVMLKDPKSNDELPPYLGAESTEIYKNEDGSWDYISCSCDGVGTLPGVSFNLEKAQESGDYCHFKRENGRRTLSCVGVCPGKCQAIEHSVSAKGVGSTRPSPY